MYTNLTNTGGLKLLDRKYTLPSIVFFSKFSELNLLFAFHDSHVFQIVPIPRVSDSIELLLYICILVIRRLEQAEVMIIGGYVIGLYP